MKQHNKCNYKLNRMKTLLAILLFLAITTAGQDTLYYDSITTQHPDTIHISYFYANTQPDTIFIVKTVEVVTDSVYCTNSTDQKHVEAVMILDTIIKYDYLINGLLDSLLTNGAMDENIIVLGWKYLGCI